MKLLNFAHPLNQDSLADLSEVAGQKVQEVVVPVHLDLDRPLKPQLDALVNILIEQKPDYVSPPSLAVAAAWIGRAIEAHTPSARLIFLKRDSSIPPRWRLGDVVGKENTP